MNNDEIDSFELTRAEFRALQIIAKEMDIPVELALMHALNMRISKEERERTQKE